MVYSFHRGYSSYYPTRWPGLHVNCLIYLRCLVGCLSINHGPLRSCTPPTMTSVRQLLENVGNQLALKSGRSAQELGVDDWIAQLESECIFDQSQLLDFLETQDWTNLTIPKGVKLMVATQLKPKIDQDLPRAQHLNASSHEFDLYISVRRSSLGTFLTD